MDEEIRNIKITIEYDGTSYNGWQTQQNAVGIQDIIQDAAQKITNEEIKLIGASRTDAGVHALGQVANFKTVSKIPFENIQSALNSILPDDIAIVDVENVPLNFHSRYSCISKKYVYVINNSKTRSAIHRSHEYHYPYKLDSEKMKIACNYFIGSHDFKAFMSSGSSIRDNTVRTIEALNIFMGDDVINFEIVADGFLYNMVRIIIGTLLEVGRGKIKPEEISKIIDSKERKNAGKTAPANGLYLAEIYY